jgi:hypothetical protein
MNLPQEAGRYHALPNNWAVNNSKGGNIQFVVTFDLLEKLTDNGWNDITSLGQQVTGFFYLTQNNGNELNKRTVQNLREVLGWVGGANELANGEYGNIEVQVTIEFENFDGKSRPKVKWLNPRDYEGPGGAENDLNAIQNLDAKYGPQLRALTAATTTTLKPKEDANKIAAQTCWERFRASAPAGATKEDIAAQWKKSIAVYFGTKDPKTITALEWQAFSRDEFKKSSPAALSPDTFDPSDIPF